MTATKIEWADAVWNPTTGCDRVSPGCDNCYALTLAKRLKGMGSEKYQRDGDPRTSGPGFGHSMSDLFHKDVPDEFIAQVFAVMALAPQHTFMVLTKRPQRMAALLGEWHGALAEARPKPERDELWLARVASAIDEIDPGAGMPGWPLANVWLGTSVEDQRYADLRIPHLLATPAAVRFLSCEPLLGPVDLSRWLPVEWSEIAECWGYEMMAEAGYRSPIDWVIAGGESGPGARPMHPDWARALRDQCEAAGVPYFFKQWGEWALAELVHCERSGGTVETARALVMRRVGKKAAGRVLDGRTHDAFPAVDGAAS